jgi:hypothetical protein
VQHTRGVDGSDLALGAELRHEAVEEFLVLTLGAAMNERQDNTLARPATSASTAVPRCQATQSRSGQLHFRGSDLKFFTCTEVKMERPTAGLEVVNHGSDLVLGRGRALQRHEREKKDIKNKQWGTETCTRRRTPGHLHGCIMWGSERYHTQTSPGGLHSAGAVGIGDIVAVEFSTHYTQ